MPQISEEKQMDAIENDDEWSWASAARRSCVDFQSDLMNRVALLMQLTGLFETMVRVIVGMTCDLTVQIPQRCGRKPFKICLDFEALKCFCSEFFNSDDLHLKKINGLWCRNAQRNGEREKENRSRTIVKVNPCDNTFRAKVFRHCILPRFGIPAILSPQILVETKELLLLHLAVTLYKQPYDACIWQRMHRLKTTVVEFWDLGMTPLVTRRRAEKMVTNFDVIYTFLRETFDLKELAGLVEFHEM
mmetsp:Transcript_34560/g.83618  ORF Transcript_34560/g.83618 Transcript_34560/m.83618 type:complete len:246 (-) Transcript_34560:52-789(-)